MILGGTAIINNGIINNQLHTFTSSGGNRHNLVEGNLPIVATNAVVAVAVGNNYSHFVVAKAIVVVLHTVVGDTSCRWVVVAWGFGILEDSHNLMAATAVAVDNYCCFGLN